MVLTTPDAIRTLQRKLYGKPKTEPGYRFYQLYDKVWRADILHHAYDLARANKGAPGVDGGTFEQIEAAGLADWLTRLGEELRTRTYQCQPVRRVMIPKPGGGERPLGIPTIRDRVVQTAAKLVLEPILEADLEPAAYGYRPKRSATDAIQLVLTLLRQGYTDVVDADLSKYFDGSSDYPPVPDDMAKRSTFAPGSLIRKPFRRPWRRCTACSSPRFTRCRTVWRDTPSCCVASIMGMKPGGGVSTKRLSRSSVMRISQGAPGVGCSAGMKPSSIQRSTVLGARLNTSAALRTVSNSPICVADGSVRQGMPR
jgi:hypothetical protein